MRKLFVLLLLLIAIYLLGPVPPVPQLDNLIPTIPDDFELYINKKEQELNVKQGNETQFLWYDTIQKNKTSYCLLYLHGFSASWYEGYPTNVKFAEHFKMNAYMPRLAAHGLITTEPLLDMTPDNLWRSAKEALVIASRMGEKVIIMSTSTGGTLALKLAAEFPENIHGLILLSPNIRIHNKYAFFLSKPWGLKIAQGVYKGKYRTVDTDTLLDDCKYWNCRYRVEALVYLQQLVEETMNKKTFERVSSPVFLGYYYKDERHQDEVVRVDAMLKMYEQLGTAPNKKVKISFPEAEQHVIGCELTSKTVDDVIYQTIEFGNDVLNLISVKE